MIRNKAILENEIEYLRFRMQLKEDLLELIEIWSLAIYS